MTKKKNRPFMIVLLAVSVTLFVVGAIMLARIELNYREAENEYEQLEEYVVIMPESAATVTEPNEVTSETGNEGTYFPKIEVDEEALREINEDYRCWMLMPCVGICYPIVQGEDNDYYLKHTYKATYNSSGCLFEDYINSPDFSDKNTFIYGHNMRNGSMFGCLKRLRKEEGLCDSDPYIYLYKGDEVTIYRIFSYYVTDTAKYANRPEQDRFLIIASEATVEADTENLFTTYEDYLQRAFDLSEYESAEEIDVDWSTQPKLLTLSTCYGASGTTRRLLVHAVCLGTYNYK